MNPHGVQALIVFTDPLCLFTLDLVHEGLTSEAEIASRVARRLGVSTDRAAAVLDGLIGIGYVGRLAPGVIESHGLRHFGERMEEAVAQIAWLRSVGEERHARDCVAAIYAAWDLRSDTPGRRHRGEVFRRSASGRRFLARVADRTLGHRRDTVDAGEYCS